MTSHYFRRCSSDPELRNERLEIIRNKLDPEEVNVVPVSSVRVRILLFAWNLVLGFLVSDAMVLLIDQTRIQVRLIVQTRGQVLPIPFLRFFDRIAAS